MKKSFFDYEKEQHHFSFERMRVIFFIAAFLFIVLIARLFFVTNFTGLEQKRSKRFIQDNTTSIWRGQISDCHGSPLALSYYAYDVGIHPHSLSLYSPSQKKQLLSLLKIAESQLKRFEQKKRFSYLVKSRKIDMDSLNKLKKLPYLTLEKKVKRYYPMGEATSTLLGFINNKGHGVEGLEYVFDKYLFQEKTLGAYWSSPRGQKKLLENTDILSEQDLQLSIDGRLQALLYQEVKKTFNQFKMHSLSAVVLNPQDFSVKAIVSYPSFNPHQRPAYSDAYRLKPLGDIFEPGSVLKPLTLAFLLEKNPDLIKAKVPTSPGYFYVDEKRIRDIRNYGTLSLEGILRVSSNVGIAKLVLEHSQGHLLDFWHQFSLMQGSQIEFRPEAAGDIPDYILEHSFSEALLGFGYGLKMNLVQLAQLYAIIAGDGTWQPVTLLANPHSSREKHQVFNDETIKVVRQLLKAPVNKGTARRAFSKDVSVAGKTGTAKRINERGEYEKIYNSFFVSMFPSDRPKYVIAIYADDPRGDYYGGVVCAPIVKNLAHQFMQLP